MRRQGQKHRSDIQSAANDSNRFSLERDWRFAGVEILRWIKICRCSGGGDVWQLLGIGGQNRAEPGASGPICDWP